MNATHSVARLRQTGFTLVELMVTLSVVAVLLLAVYGTFFRSEASMSRMTKAVDARQNARATLQLLEREMRMVGSGWGRLPVNCSDNGSSMSRNPLTVGFGGVNANDSLGLFGSWSGVTTTLRADMPTTTSTIQCQSTAGFQNGDMVVVTNGSAAHLFQITSISSSPADLSHDGSSPWNNAGGFLGWPAGGYATGAQVFRANWVTYYVDSTNVSRSSLMRRELNGPIQIVAPNVARFRVWYQLQDSSFTRAPTDMSMVDKIRPVVLYSFENSARQTVNDSVWAVVRPRTF
jgi:prepilin-type N-terminal cleavage/methylation domain-containing protein